LREPIKNGDFQVFQMIKNQWVFANAKRERVQEKEGERSKKQADQQSARSFGVI